MPAQQDSTQRFSDRVEDYVKYRPSYPPALLDLLRNAMGLTAASVIADIGSGTGKSTELFLKAGCRVFAVEPNAPMRQSAENLLGANPNFTSIAGRAEATTLPDCSVDIITAGQAFHWFNPSEARTEFSRILKPRGFVVFFWNTRIVESSGFSQAYDTMLNNLSPDYAAVRHDRHSAEKVNGFFAPLACNTALFDYRQTFDFAGFRGRVLSSSYVPKSGPAHDSMMRQLREIFDEYQRDGQIDFQYKTEVFYGHLQ